MSNILDDILLHICKPPKKHDGEKVGKSTVKGRLSKDPWLEINDSYTNMRCSVCVEMKSKLKLSSVWANEGTPNIQSSSITRHNSSSEHNHACTESEKCKIQADTDQDLSDIDLSDTSTPVSGVDKIVFNTVHFAAKNEIPFSSINEHDIACLDNLASIFSA